MREYKLHKMGKYTRKCEVRRQHLEVRVLALIICFLLACVIWLYVVGLSRIPVETPPMPGEEETSAVQEEDTGSKEDTASSAAM